MKKVLLVAVACMLTVSVSVSAMTIQERIDKNEAIFNALTNRRAELQNALTTVEIERSNCVAIHKELTEILKEQELIENNVPEVISTPDVADEGEE